MDGHANLQIRTYEVTDKAICRGRFMPKKRPCLNSFLTGMRETAAAGLPPLAAAAVGLARADLGTGILLVDVGI